MTENQFQRLDETGFEFIGDDGRRYLCRMIDDDPWFCYKHPDGEWVTFRQVNQTEVWAANDRRLETQEEVKKHRADSARAMEFAGKAKAPAIPGDLVVKLQQEIADLRKENADLKSKSLVGVYATKNSNHNCLPIKVGMPCTYPYCNCELKNDVA